jgi:type I restriction enzyme S subunit
VNFRTARLGEICDINPKMPKSLDDGVLASFLPMAAISEEGRIAFEEERSVAEVKKGFTYFERGDVLVAKITPCFENGKASRTASLSKPFGFGSTEFHVLRANSEVLPDFLFYKIWNSSFRRLGVQSMTGSAGQKRVPSDFLKRLEIRVPSLEEQQRIVAILDKADVLRRKRKHALNLLGSLTQSIFLEMFGDPVSNPKGWPVVKLGSIVSKIGSGATPIGGDAAYKSTGVAFVRSMNVRDEGFLSKGLAFIDDAQAAKLANVTLEGGDVLLNITGASVARVCLCPERVLPARVSQHVSIIRPIQKSLNQFIASALKMPAMKVKLLGTAESGATRQAITKAQIEEIRLPMPPSDQVNKYKDVVERYLEMHQAAQNDLHARDSLFSSIQTRAFSGELE